MVISFLEELFYHMKYHDCVELFTYVSYKEVSIPSLGEYTCRPILEHYMNVLVFMQAHCTGDVNMELIL